MNQLPRKAPRGGGGVSFRRCPGLLTPPLRCSFTLGLNREAFARLTSHNGLQPDQPQRLAARRCCRDHVRMNDRGRHSWLKAWLNRRVASFVRTRVNRQPLILKGTGRENDTRANAIAAVAAAQGDWSSATGVVKAWGLIAAGSMRTKFAPIVTGAASHAQSTTTCSQSTTACSQSTTACSQGTTSCSQSTTAWSQSTTSCSQTKRICHCKTAKQWSFTATKATTGDHACFRTSR